MACELLAKFNTGLLTGSFKADNSEGLVSGVIHGIDIGEDVIALSSKTELVLSVSPITELVLALSSIL